MDAIELAKDKAEREKHAAYEKNRIAQNGKWVMSSTWHAARSELCNCFFLFKLPFSHLGLLRSCLMLGPLCMQRPVCTFTALTNVYTLVAFSKVVAASLARSPYELEHCVFFFF
jgi:hypothetical protein